MGATCGIQDLINHMMLFTADGGNIDCVHPVQEVVDRLCGDDKLTHAHKLETWFESYANMRGTTARTFKTLSSCVRGPAISWVQLSL